MTAVGHFALTYAGLWLWQLRDRVTPILFGQTLAIAVVLRSSPRTRGLVVAATTVTAVLATGLAHSTSGWLLAGSAVTHGTGILVTLAVVRMGQWLWPQRGEAPGGLSVGLARTLLLVALASPVAAGAMASAFAHLAGSTEARQIFWLRWGSNVVGTVSVLPFALTASATRLRVLLTGKDAPGFYATLAMSLVATWAACTWFPFPFVVIALPLLYAASRFLVLGSSIVGCANVLLLVFLSLQTGAPQSVLHRNDWSLPVAIGFTLVSPLVVGLLAEQRSQALSRLAEVYAAMLDAAERRRIILDSIGDAVITIDADRCVDYLNPVAERLTGWTQAEASGVPIEEVWQLFEDASDRTPSAPMGARAASPLVRCMVERRTISLMQPLVLRHRSGSLAFVGDSAAPVFASDGEQIVGAVAVFQDVTDKHQASRVMHRRAMHDGLTNLFNRAEFEQRLSGLLAEDAVGGRQHVACFIDLDRFKAVNDTYGHAAGDAVLRAVADTLRRSTRTSDLVGRLGGDEFALCLVACPSAPAERLPTNLLRAISAVRVPWDGTLLSVGASIGMVVFTAHECTLEVLLRRADTACYASKRAGRGIVSTYHDGMPDASS